MTPHPSESHPISLGAHAPGALQLRASGTTGAAAPTSRGPRRRLANAIRGSRQARPLAGRFQSGRASSPSVCPKRAASGQPAAVCGVFLPAVYFLWNTALVSCGGFLFWNTVLLSQIQCCQRYSSPAKRLYTICIYSGFSRIHLKNKDVVYKGWNNVKESVISKRTVKSNRTYMREGGWWNSVSVHE